MPGLNTYAGVTFDDPPIEGPCHEPLFPKMYVPFILASTVFRTWYRIRFFPIAAPRSQAARRAAFLTATTRQPLPSAPVAAKQNRHVGTAFDVCTMVGVGRRVQSVPTLQKARQLDLLDRRAGLQEAAIEWSRPNLPP
ncbi:hypothetical protein [Salipiger abyssi]|uniref:hypothetical protein n=1 Tax=Salipiger abyssi TaxID=1250539 RepID=UPI001A8F623A|nr:hypothetical protein [Salipiger abyssi]MBN9888751.1 hypothetical protein [Salipiger abyssi]